MHTRTPSQVIFCTDNIEMKIKIFNDYEKVESKTLWDLYFNNPNITIGIQYMNHVKMNISETSVLPAQELGAYSIHLSSHSQIIRL